MQPRWEIKARARAAFKEQGSAIILAGLVFVLFELLQTHSPMLIGRFVPSVTYPIGDQLVVVYPSITYAFTLVSLFVMMPLGVGYASLCIRAYRGIHTSAGGLVHVGFGRYGRNLAGMLYVSLFTVLWSLLFIIPGIIKSISYSMTKYIMAEYEGIGGKKALQLSMRITQGRKMDIFVFMLSFFGWVILTALTWGVLAVYTVPYMNVSIAGLYYSLKRDALARGTVSQADFY